MRKAMSSSVIGQAIGSILILMVGIWLVLIVTPSFTGMATSQATTSVFQNATGCYIDTVGTGADVLVDCSTYQMSQAVSKIIPIIPYLVILFICVGALVAAVKWKL